jgi:hypothetical protein
VAVATADLCADARKEMFGTVKANLLDARKVSGSTTRGFVSLNLVSADTGEEGLQPDACSSVCTVPARRLDGCATGLSATRSGHIRPLKRGTNPK